MMPANALRCASATARRQTSRARRPQRGNCARAHCTICAGLVSAPGWRATSRPPTISASVRMLLMF